MEQPLPRHHVVLLAFGMPVLTTLIVMGSMYAGFLMTVASQRPTEVRVQAAPPKIDVNVPQAAAPNIQVSAAAPKIDVHVPQVAAPAVTVNTPQAAAPQIVVNPATPTVTIIDRRDDKPRADAPQLAKAALPATPVATTQPTAAPAAPARHDAVATFNSAPTTTTAAAAVKPPDTHVDPLGDDATLDNLYAHATRYIELYCRKRGLDPAAESKRWNAAWRANVDQAISDNIDSSEQTYINRIVIAKRDYFNMHTASPEKVVEACRILLRYRDGQLAWMQAMKDALTNENLRKTMSFLAMGPQ